MTETHIAHAIATFSELGIGTSLVWLGDVVKFRESLDADLVMAEEGLRIATADYHTKAEGFDGSIRTAIRYWLACRKWCYTKIIELLLGLMRWSPYVCIAFGVISLFGISFYPEAPSLLPKVFVYSKESLDKIYFTISFLSFLVILMPFIAMITKVIINRYVLKNIRIE